MKLVQEEPNNINENQEIEDIKEQDDIIEKKPTNKKTSILNLMLIVIIFVGLLFYMIKWNIK